MRVFVSFDMEGIAGIVDWEQCVGSGPPSEIGRRLTLGEVNAAIDGALEAGATEILVNDSHWTMQNLPPDQLHGGASYVSGRHKPGYMTEGLDGSFDTAIFVGYHGSAGTSSVLSHTYNPNAISEVRLNGHVAGETAINALVACHHGVPIALITGDATTAEESVWFAPDAERVIVKESSLGSRHGAFTPMLPAGRSARARQQRSRRWRRGAWPRPRRTHGPADRDDPK